jgi:DNA replication protein DnaC
MQTLIESLKTIRLEAFASGLETAIDRHSGSREAIIDVLSELVKAERAARQERTVAYRIKEARFERIETVEKFDFDYNPSTRRLKNRYLKLIESDITAQGMNSLFVGGSGLGKTHLARAAGYRLCQKGVRVLFSTMSAMTLALSTADTTGTLKNTMEHYTQPALLILDEVGYVRMSETESNLAFQIISQRHDKRRSTIVTTNRPFGEWNQIFHNDAIAHACLDRLVERSEVFHLEGKSYRETHRQRLKT